MACTVWVLSILPPHSSFLGGLAILRVDSAGNCPEKAVWPDPLLPGCSALCPLHPPDSLLTRSIHPQRSLPAQGRLMDTPTPEKWVPVGCGKDWHCAIIPVMGFHCKLGRRRQKTDKNTHTPQPQKVPLGHKGSHDKTWGGRNAARAASPPVQPWEQSYAWPMEVLLREQKEKLALQRGLGTCLRLLVGYLLRAAGPACLAGGCPPSPGSVSARACGWPGA